MRVGEIDALERGPRFSDRELSIHRVFEAAVGSFLLRRSVMEHHRLKQTRPPDEKNAPRGLAAGPSESAVWSAGQLGLRSTHPRPMAARAT